MQVVFFLGCAWIALKKNVFANGPCMDLNIGGFGSASLLSTCGLVWCMALLPWCDHAQGQFATIFLFQGWGFQKHMQNQNMQKCIFHVRHAHA